MSIISAIFLKKSFFEYWQKIDFFQFFPNFHKDFSKDFLTKLVKSSMFRGSILISEYLKDVLHDDTRIQQIFLQSTFSQHLLIQRKIIQNRPVYENLWNDDVRTNLWTIFEVDHKLILYLKSNGCIFGKVWFTSWYLPGGDASWRRKIQYRDLISIPFVTHTKM